MSIILNNNPISSIKVYKLTQKQSISLVDYSIMYNLKGYIEAGGIPLSPGDFVLIPPRHVISLSPTSECEVCLISFNNVILLSTLDNSALFSQIINTLSNQPFKQLSSYIEDIIRNHDNSKEISSFFTFIEQLNLIYPYMPSLNADETSPALWDKIIHYIHQRNFDILSSNQVAEAFDITPQYLSSLFKKNSNYTCKEYLNLEKIKVSVPFLLYTTWTPEAIASVVGFSSPDAMSRALKSQSYNLDDLLLTRMDFAEMPLPDDCIHEDYDFHLFGGVSAANIQASEPVDKAVSESSVAVLPQQSFSDSWKSILNIGDVTNMSSSELRDQIIKAQSNFHFKYARVKELLSFTSTSTVDGHEYYMFGFIFQIIDFFLTNHLIPYISCKSFDPSILSVFIRNCYNRYGAEYLSKWRFELSYDFTRENVHETIWDYLTRLSQFENIVHSNAPLCSVGGPDYNSIIPIGEFENFLKAISDKHIRVDFVSFQVTSSKDITPDSGMSSNGILMSKRTQLTISAIRKYLSNCEIYISEFGLYHNKKNYLNDSLFAACVACWYITNYNHLVDGMGYGMFSDISTHYSDSHGLFYGGPGMVNYLGIRKPVYSALRLFNQLGTYRLNQDAGMLVTASSRYNFQVLAYHTPTMTEACAESSLNEELLHSDNNCFDGMVPRMVSFSLTDVNNGNYLVKEYRINQSQGNVLKEYAKIRGITDLSQHDIDCFLSLSRPSSTLYPISVHTGRPLQIDLIIEPLEIVLLQIDFNSKGELK